VGIILGCVPDFFYGRLFNDFGHFDRCFVSELGFRKTLRTRNGRKWHKNRKKSKKMDFAKNSFQPHPRFYMLFGASLFKHF
jgi:hypothetical protein